MAKLKTRRRRRVRLRRVAVVLLVIVALCVAAAGVVTLHIRSIVLGALRKQLPRCDVDVGRASLNPFEKLVLYDVTITDRSNPETPSKIELDQITATFALKAGLRFDIGLDVPGSRIALGEVTGETPPFPDLLEPKEKRKPSRFRLRQVNVRDCHVTVADPGFDLDTTLDLRVTGLGDPDATHPAEIELNLRDLAFTSASAGPSGGESPPDETHGMGTAVRIGQLEGLFGYDAKEPEVDRRLLLHQVRASKAAVVIRYPDFELQGRLSLGLKNDAGSPWEQPTRLAADFDRLVLDAGGMRTIPGEAAIDGEIALDPDGPAATLTGKLGLTGLDASLDGVLNRAGLNVTAVFRQQQAKNLVDLFVHNEEYKIPVIHDFENLDGTIERFELALSHTPELGLSLTGHMVADGLTGSSTSMKLDVEGMALDATFSLVPPEPGRPLELVVGDPNAEPGPGRIVADSVTWAEKFTVTDGTGSLSMTNDVWYLSDMLGVLFGGQGTGTIEALPDGTIKFDLQFSDVNLAPASRAVGAKPDQVSGHADGALSITLVGNNPTSLKGVLRTRAPGGLLRFKEKEKSFNALPGGDQVLGAVRQNMGPRGFDHFLEKFKNYQYESITIEAQKSDNDYVLEVKIRDADKKNPLPVDLTIRYSRKVVIHDGPPPQ